MGSGIGGWLAAMGTHSLTMVYGLATLAGQAS